MSERITRRIPIDFEAVAKESGLSEGKLCRSPHFGWCVQNRGEMTVATITPPAMEPGETRLAINAGNWFFYAETP